MALSGIQATVLFHYWCRMATPYDFEFAWGLNNSGVIVGAFDDARSNTSIAPMWSSQADIPVSLLGVPNSYLLQSTTMEWSLGLLGEASSCGRQV